MYLRKTYRDSHMGVWWKGIPSRLNSKCKALKVGASLVYVDASFAHIVPVALKGQHGRKCGSKQEVVDQTGNRVLSNLYQIKYIESTYL